MELSAAAASGGGLSARLLQLARQRVEALRHRIQSGDCTIDDAIHEIRVATKEFRAYLHLLPSPSLKPFRRRENDRLRRTARRLAVNRDLRVIRETLERLAQKCANVATRHSLHRMLLQLGELHLETPPGRVRLSTSVQQLATFVGQARSRFRPSLADDTLVDAVATAYRRTRRCTRKVRGKPDTRTWHDWRKRVKALHYQVAWLSDLWPGRLRRIGRETWALQGRLGRYHDLWLARDKIQRLRIDPINEPCRERTLRLIDRRLRRVEDQIRRKSRDFLAEPAPRFARKLRRRLRA